MVMTGAAIAYSFPVRPLGGRNPARLTRARHRYDIRPCGFQHGVCRTCHDTAPYAPNHRGNGRANNRSARANPVLNRPTAESGAKPRCVNRYLTIRFGGKKAIRIQNLAPMLRVTADSRLTMQNKSGTKMRLHGTGTTPARRALSTGHPQGVKARAAYLARRSGFANQGRLPCSD